MDPVTMYHLGQIRQQEIVQDAEQRYQAQQSDPRPSLWQRLNAFASAIRPQAAEPCDCPPQKSQALA